MIHIALTALPVVALIAITKYHLSGEDLSKYDTPDIPVTFNPQKPSKGAADVEAVSYTHLTLPTKA